MGRNIIRNVNVMINTLIALKKEHQKEILFFLTETLQKKCFKNIIGFDFNRIGGKILSITFHLKEYNKKLEKELEKELEKFINLNFSNNLHFENQEIKELFLDYKTGVIKSNRIDSSFALEHKIILSNFSKTNIKILKELEKSSNFYETLINVFIIFIYIIGAIILSVLDESSYENVEFLRYFTLSISDKVLKEFRLVLRVKSAPKVIPKIFLKTFKRKIASTFIFNLHKSYNALIKCNLRKLSRICYEVNSIA